MMDVIEIENFDTIGEEVRKISPENGYLPKDGTKEILKRYFEGCYIASESTRSEYA